MPVFALPIIQFPSYLSITNLTYLTNPTISTNPIISTNPTIIIIQQNKTISEFIQDLPEEIKNKIYKEYFEPLFYYAKYEHLIKQGCINNNYHVQHLLLLLPSLLIKPIVIRYLCKKCEGFLFSYKIHKIENTKRFDKMNKGESFVYCVVLYINH